MKKALKVLTATSILSLLAILLTPLASLAITVNGVYTPFWSSQYVTSETEGMWGAFYINKSDNTMRTDLVKVTDACYRAPGDDNRYTQVWEGLNVVQPGDSADLGYIFTAIQGGKIEFTIVGKLDVAGCSDLDITITKNGFTNKVYPTDSATLLCKSGVEQNINFQLELAQGDKIYFRFHSADDVANKPQFRFTTFQAVWRSVGSTDTTDSSSSASQTENSSSVSDSSTASAVSSDTASASSSAGSSSQSSSSGQSSSGGVVIATETDFAIQSKYTDVTVDKTANTITLTKKLTLSDFMDSFTCNDGIVIKVFNSSDNSQVTDTAAVITSDMVAKLYNQGTPTNVLKIVTNYSETGTTSSGTSSGNTAFIIVIILLAVLLLAIIGAGLAYYFLKIRKHKGN